MDFENQYSDMLGTLRSLVKYNSVKGEASQDAPEGPEVKACLEEALKTAEDMGFKTGNTGNYAGYAEFGEGDDYVAVLGHLDIVPAGSDWTYPPFACEEHDGKIYGRGVNDDKGPLVAALYGAKSLMDEGEKLGSKVRLIFGTSEETGGNDLEKYLESEKAPKAGFTPDAGFPVINAEKGIVNVEISKKINTGNVEFISLSGGSAPNMVPDRARAVYLKDGKEEKLEVMGISAHGSTPEKGDNAVFKLLEKLKGENSDLNGEFSFLLDSLRDTTGKDMGSDLHDEASGYLSVNTGMIILKDGILTLTLNMRVPVTFDLRDVEGPMVKHFEPRGWKVTPGNFTPPLYYPKDHPLVETLMDVYREITGDKESSPIAIGGGTYAKAMPNTVAFGPGFPGREDVDHIADEYILKDDFIKWASIFREAIKRLSFIGREEK